MKPAKTQDLRNLTDAELEQQIIDNERSLLDMHFNLAVGTLENPAAFRIVRRDIARMKTILHERKAEAAVATQ